MKYLPWKIIFLIGLFTFNAQALEEKGKQPGNVEKMSPDVLCPDPHIFCKCYWSGSEYSGLCVSNTPNKECFIKNGKIDCRELCSDYETPKECSEALLAPER